MAKKRKILIARTDLAKFMTSEAYEKFWEEVRNRIKNSDDCASYHNEPLWLIVEW